MVFLLGGQIGMMAASAPLHSPTIDEAKWLPAGIEHWRAGSFRAGNVNPPFVRMLAAAPLVWLYPDESSRSNDETGLVRALGPRSLWFFTLGRWACLPLSLIGGYVCFRWARQLYGTPCGFVALCLWCFCPNVLAHGQLIANDGAAASFGVAAGYAFWRWLRSSSWPSAISAGVVLGLAELMKMSLLVLFIAFPVVWVCWRLSGDDPKRLRGWLMSALQLGLILLLSIDVINAGYLCEGTGRRLGEYSFVSQALGGVNSESGGIGNRFRGSFVERLPILLPENYVLGLDCQKRDLEVGNAVQFSYLRGEWSRRGWWYFYLYALAIKVPLGTWSLFGLAIWERVFRADAIRRFRDELVLAVPPLLLLAVASSQTGFTDHFRYVLPVLPFAFIWISRVARVIAHRRWITSFLMFAAFSWSIASSLLVYPHSLSYFNELAGGPLGGHFHLLSSNIDYGQDLLFLKAWVDRHPEARPLKLAIWNMGTVNPAVAGIEYTQAPSGPPPGAHFDAESPIKYGPQPGWFAVNVNVLHGDDWPGRVSERTFGYYGYFLNFAPVATAGYSIYIYHLSAADVQRYWRQVNQRDRVRSL